MNINEILANNSHRPWAIPTAKWQIYQEWNRAVFLHWKVSVEDLSQWVPSGIEIDLFEGEAWISLVAFTMERIKPRNLPSIGWVSNFEEVNIRTYVRRGHITGVNFLSIEAEKWISCYLARKISPLPYRKSAMLRSNGSYNSSNAIFNDELKIEYQLGPPLGSKSDLDRWLTERYAVLQDSGDKIAEFQVHHREWPIHEIEIKKLHVSYPRFKKLLETKPDKVHYSPGVQVVSWGRDVR